MLVVEKAAQGRGSSTAGVRLKRLRRVLGSLLLFGGVVLLVAHAVTWLGA